MVLLTGRRLVTTLLIYSLVAASTSLPSFGFKAVHQEFHESNNTTCEAGNTDPLALAEGTIIQYLGSNEDNGKFHVQGWRWHTMSMIREADRLQKAAERMVRSGDNEDPAALKKAANYVVDFNMKGLHKIEKDLFFPWIRKKLGEIKESKMSMAVETVVDQLESDRKSIEHLGLSLNAHVAVASDATAPASSRMHALNEVASKAAEIVEHGRSMMRLEDSLLVPTVARFVSESEQKSFNSQVIRNLGILDSRLHLVGMHEAVCDLDSEAERALFQEAIPYVPRMMIPRWKRLLYEPAAGALNNV